MIAILFFGPCGGGGFTLEGKSIISPVLPLGRGGGGCRLGSVGLSDEDDDDVVVKDLTTAAAGLLVGGGVIGLGIRLVVEGGDGVGDGGRGRALLRDDFCGGDIGFEEAVVFVRERGSENERDLKTKTKVS